MKKILLVALSVMVLVVDLGLRAEDQDGDQNDRVVSGAYTYSGQRSLEISEPLRLLELSVHGRAPSEYSQDWRIYHRQLLKLSEAPFFGLSYTQWRSWLECLQLASSSDLSQYRSFVTEVAKVLNLALSSFRFSSELSNSSNPDNLAYFNSSDAYLDLVALSALPGHRQGRGLKAIQDIVISDIPNFLKILQLDLTNQVRRDDRIGAFVADVKHKRTAERFTEQMQKFVLIVRSFNPMNYPTAINEVMFMGEDLRFNPRSGVGFRSAVLEWIYQILKSTPSKEVQKEYSEIFRPLIAAVLKTPIPFPFHKIWLIRTEMAASDPHWRNFWNSIEFVDVQGDVLMRLRSPELSMIPFFFGSLALINGAGYLAVQSGQLTGLGGIALSATNIGLCALGLLYYHNKRVESD